MFFSLPGIMVCSFPCTMESVDFSLLLWFVWNKIEAILFLIVTTSSSDRCSYFIDQVGHPFLPHLLMVIIPLNYSSIKTNVELVWIRVSSLVLIQ